MGESNEDSANTSGYEHMDREDSHKDAHQLSLRLLRHGNHGGHDLLTR
jgi:hypothetical protein